MKGYWCHHPDNKLHVLFETFPGPMSCVINDDDSMTHYLKFDEFRCSGYFFIKWDQNRFDQEVTYSDHLATMVAEIKKIEANQTVASKTEFDLKQHYGLLPGSPYGFITIAGDGFLFGFAVKGKEGFSYDINSLIRRVKWTMS